jgi:hypothetical protein
MKILENWRMALKEFYSGHFREALHIIEKPYRDGVLPDTVQCHHIAGSGYAEMGEYADAVRSYDGALALAAVSGRAEDVLTLSLSREICADMME